MSSSPCEECGGRVCGPRRGGGGGIRQESWSPESPRLPRCPRPPAVITAAHSARRPSSQQLRLSGDRDLQPGLYLWGWGGWGGPSQPWALTGSSSPAPWVQCLRTERQKQKLHVGSTGTSTRWRRRAGDRGTAGLRPATAVTIQKQFRVTTIPCDDNPKRSSRRCR